MIKTVHATPGLRSALRRRCGAFLQAPGAQASLRAILHGAGLAKVCQGGQQAAAFGMTNESVETLHWAQKPGRMPRFDKERSDSCCDFFVEKITNTLADQC